MQVLSLGQTLGFSNKTGRYVQCFAGLDLATNELLRVLDCDFPLPVGIVFDMGLAQARKDPRIESKRLKSAPEPIGEISISETFNLLRSKAFGSFEDAMESGVSMAAVSVRSFDFCFARDFKSNIDLIDTTGDRLCLRYLASESSPKVLPKKWLSGGSPAIALIGNKKLNRDWIGIRIFQPDF